MKISFLILSGLIPLSSLAANSPRSPQVNPLKNMNGSMNLTTAEILAKDLAETPYLKLEADMTADDIVPAKKNPLFHNLNYDPNEGPSPFLRQNINFSYSVDPSTGKIRFDDPDNRPKLLVLVQKNDPNPCDLDGALAQQKNPNLVFETMRLFNEFGEELKYPVINEVSTFESNDSSIGEVYNYSTEHTDDKGNIRLWNYDDPRASRFKNRYKVQAPQFGKNRRCIYVSTGDPKKSDTPVGVFRPVNGRLYPSDSQDTTYVSRSYGDPMPWAVFYYNGYALHATGVNYYQWIGGPASHGCIRQSVQDAQWLFQQIRNTWSKTPLVQFDINGQILSEKKASYNTVISVQGRLTDSLSNYFRSTETAKWIEN
jgi:hypothetical protein